jgi:hypothetical protein
MVFSRRYSQKPRRGSVTAWLVVSLAVIIAIVAIGLDGGRMMEERRRVQAAADAAALAAAADLFANYGTNQGADPNQTAQQAALVSAAANGYSNDGTSSIVTVNIGPSSGFFQGQAGYVEVIVLSNLQGTFGAAIVPGPLAVKGRAVARGKPKNIGVMLLAPNANGAYTAGGNASLTVVDAALVVNSTSPIAFNNGGGTVQASSFQIAGGYTSTGPMIGPITTGVSPMADPLRSLPVPQILDYPVRSVAPLYLGGTSSTTLQPGVYQGGIHLSDSANVTLLPGVYIFDAGTLDVGSSANLTGNGVMIYFTNFLPDEITINGSGNVTLSPPTSGLYQGVCIFQDRQSNQTIYLLGGGAMQVTGVIYAPAAQMQLSGTANGNTVGGGFIVSSMVFWGNASATVRMGSVAPPIPDCRLVE